ncbi:hypothetical protein B0F90DRAFT_1819197 [Multifurca ochricompacta]|uniref:Pre-mRNA-splicing factor 38B n=1 Tax=Multifurca ochricompacta TaxID=376703 RepID=A0AAD4M2U8_9AGAM|nr:hypothetical protein B0F90DRAFT_1819197 [Multifurca ochricompacta]
MADSSLSSVVSGLLRAQMGASVSSTVTDEDLDRHVAELILNEAKKKAEQYGQQGIRAYLPQPESNVPKANKRFLSSIIRNTDDHNKSVLRAQALSGAEIRIEREAQVRADRRARAEEAAAAERARRSRRGRDDSWDRDRRRRERSREWLGSDEGEDRWQPSKRRQDDGEEEHHGDHRSARRSRGGEDSLSSRRRKRRSPSPSDEEEKRHWRRRRTHTRTHTRTSRSRSPEGASERKSRGDGEASSKRPRSPSPSDFDNDNEDRLLRRHPAQEIKDARIVVTPLATPAPIAFVRSPLIEDRTGDLTQRESDLRRKLKGKGKASLETTSRHKRSRSLTPISNTRPASHDTSLDHPRPPSPEPRPPPGPPPPLPPPADFSPMDKYFEASYDPRLDVAPLNVPNIPATGLINSAEFEGWDAMLELIKQKREDKAERKRLERLGLVEKSTLASWSEGGNGLMDIEYKKRGSVREWDLGKESPT